MKRFLFIIAAIFILYHKFIYTWFILILFFFEYGVFINYLYKIHKNYYDYYDISVKEVDLWDCNIVEIWIEYSNLLAYSRLYSTLGGRMSVNKLIISILIYITNLPIRIIKLLWYFLYTNKNSFREGMENLYISLYYTLKDRKIEVYSGNIYLNCFTIGKLLQSIARDVNDKNLLCKSLIDLRSIYKKIYEDEMKIKDPNVKLKHAIIETNEGSKISVPHYTYVDMGNTLHATSKIPNKLDKSQKVEIPLKSLMLPSAPNPGTIISEDVKKIVIIKNGPYRLLPTLELAAILYGYPDLFNMDKDSFKYIYEKNYIFSSWMQLHFKRVDVNECKLLTANHYMACLIGMNDEMILYEVENHMSGL